MIALSGLLLPLSTLHGNHYPSFHQQKLVLHFVHGWSLAALKVFYQKQRLSLFNLKMNLTRVVANRELIRSLCCAVFH